MVEKRNNVISFTLSDTEYNLLNLVCKVNNITKSYFIRNSLRKNIQAIRMKTKKNKDLKKDFEDTRLSYFG